MAMQKFKPALLALAVLSGVGVAHAETSDIDPAYIGQFLDRFHADPAKTMDELPVKSTVLGAKAPSLFSTKEIDARDYVTRKAAQRAALINGQGNAKSLPGMVRPMAAIVLPKDDPAAMVDNGANLIRNIHTMDSQNLKSAKLAVQPWSDSYWPVYAGGLGYRYGDEKMDTLYSSDWNTYYQYANVTAPRADYIAQNKIDQLSPSEKYDLLVGDNNFTLTAKSWEEGKRFYDSNGSVESWMGYCHGWAPASYTLPRPTKSVTVYANNGTPITFTPADIKALSTLLWAKRAPQARLIGNRCNTKNPAKDASGRITDLNCFDTNPGSFHQVVVNQIGVSKRSFVFDATYDFEVWNQPVLGYSYSYFNPETRAVVGSAKEAQINLSAYASDKFKKFRDPKAVAVVGVAMKLQYMVETQPTTKPNDSVADDYVTTATYVYDLELDASGKILGGEWYQNAHPDFMWTPPPGSKASTYGNPGMPWVKGEVLPRNWGLLGTTDAKLARPSSRIVDALLEWSNQ